MAKAVLSSRFEDVDGARRIREVAGNRIDDRAGDRRTGRQVNDCIGRADGGVECARIEDRADDELRLCPIEIGREPTREVVERRDGVPGEFECAAEIGADETGTTSDENVHEVPLPERTPPSVMTFAI